MPLCIFEIAMQHQTSEKLEIRPLASWRSPLTPMAAVIGGSLKSSIHLGHNESIQLRSTNHGIMTNQIKSTTSPCRHVLKRFVVSL